MTTTSRTMKIYHQLSVQKAICRFSLLFSFVFGMARRKRRMPDCVVCAFSLGFLLAKEKDSFSGVTHTHIESEQYMPQHTQSTLSLVRAPRVHTLKFFRMTKRNWFNNVDIWWIPIKTGKCVDSNNGGACTLEYDAFDGMTVLTFGHKTIQCESQGKRQQTKLDLLIKINSFHTVSFRYVWLHLFGPAVEKFMWFHQFEKSDVLMYEQKVVYFFSPLDRRKMCVLDLFFILSLLGFSEAKIRWMASHIFHRLMKYKPFSILHFIQTRHTQMYIYKAPT